MRGAARKGRPYRDRVTPRSPIAALRRVGGADAVVGEEGFCVGEIGRDAGGDKHRFVERRVGIPEGILAGEFERAIDGRDESKRGVQLNLSAREIFD